MQVTLWYMDDCPNWRVLDEHLSALAAERTDLRVEHRVIDDADEAERLGFPGSPTLLVDGADAFPTDTPVGFACRLYETPDGLAGAPTLGQVRQALQGTDVTGGRPTAGGSSA